MAKRWSAYQHELSVLSVKVRKDLYHGFEQMNPRWSERLLIALYKVVVDLESQVAVTHQMQYSKQELNRAVRNYKVYLDFCLDS